jgi:uncharacterized protein (TIGR02145 family)
MKISKSIFTAFLVACSLIMASCSGGLKDYDGNIYKTVKIGSQIWMAENLNVSHFRNGDSIPQVKSVEEWVRFGIEGKPAWCYMGNDAENGIKFGKLYNWFAGNDPRGLAPEGWHVATDSEWTGIVNYFGGGVLAALKMRSVGLADNDRNTDDQMGFSGLPGGCRNNAGSFYGADSFGYWWSATEESSTTAWVRILNYVKCDINSQNFAKSYGASVRCIRD